MRYQTHNSNRRPEDDFERKIHTWRSCQNNWDSIASIWQNLAQKTTVKIDGNNIDS